MAALLVTTALITTAATAAPVPRSGAIAGRIVAKKQGETAVLNPQPQQRPAEVRQDLKAGDVLRTNAAGTLAVVFADRTQIRIGRNSTLLVKQVLAGVPSAVQLQRGSIWARSPRGASQLSVETPSATAAIRGTEYSIAATDEQTTLTVVEGVVDFFNPQGQIQVRQGQSAAARLGQAPTRLFTVNTDSREQMLYYLSLDSALSYLRPAPAPQLAASDAVVRIKAIDPAARTSEDWVTFAESGAELEPRAAVADALARARALPLTPAQAARADLVEATQAMASRDYPRALRLMQSALPELRGRQQAVARFGVFFAQTLTDPDAAEGEPPQLDENQPASYVGQTFLAAYMGDFDKARALAQAGLQKFPEESALYQMLMGLGILTGDDKAMEAASQAGLRVDPRDAFALRTQTELELEYRGNPQGAIAKARHALTIAPADANIWNVLGQSYLAWGRTRMAEKTFQHGLAEAPNSFVLHGNYTLGLFQQQRSAKAREQLALAQALDPDNAIVHLAQGFLDIAEGKHEEALAHALDASAANPGYGETLLLLSELYYDQRDYTLAEQQLDAADRADPNSPFVPLYRAAMAIDSYRADDAIRAAREVQRRYRARGGIYATLAESKGSGSYVAGAFRLLDLGDWARYYGDREYDPFVSAALFDRALSPAPDPYFKAFDFLPLDTETRGNDAAISDLLQGARFDPLSVAGSERELHITKQKFVELSLKPAVIATNGEVAWSQAASINGLILNPLPVAFSVTVNRGRSDLPLGANNGTRVKGAQGFFGIKPAPYDNIVLYTGYSKDSAHLPGTVDQPRDNGSLRSRTAFLYGTYAHEFDRENFVTLGGGLLDARQVLARADDIVALAPVTLPTTYREVSNSKAWFGFANYAVGLGKFDLQLGGEYISAKSRTAEELSITFPGNPPSSIPFDTAFSPKQYRGYADLRLVASNALTLEGKIAVTGVKRGAPTVSNFDFSLGAAIEPAAGHWLRGAFVRTSGFDAPVTMAPTAVVGLRQADAPFQTGTRSDSFIGRWEAEWTPHFFTSLEGQHQEFDGLSFGQPNLIDELTIDDLVLQLAGQQQFNLRFISVGPSKIDRASASADLWVTGNIGLRAIYAYTDSEVKSGPGAGRAVPFVSRHFARGQFSYTDPRQIKLSGGISYLGARTIAVDGTRAPHALLGDVQMIWELLDKRIMLNAGLYNLFNEKVLLTPGVPGYGRTFAASASIRF